VAASQVDTTKFGSAAVTPVPGGIPVDPRLTNLAMTSGSATYQATHSITADTSVAIGGPASVTFTAGGSGTAFHAVIQ
jgi:hypothetical protein